MPYFTDADDDMPYYHWFTSGNDSSGATDLDPKSCIWPVSGKLGEYDFKYSWYSKLITKFVNIFVLNKDGNERFKIKPIQRVFEKIVDILEKIEWRVMKFE